MRGAKRRVRVYAAGGLNIRAGGRRLPPKKQRKVWIYHWFNKGHDSNRSLRIFLKSEVGRRYFFEGARSFDPDDIKKTVKADPYRPGSLRSRLFHFGQNSADQMFRMLKSRR